MAESATREGGMKAARVLLLGAGPLPSADSSHAPGVANRLWNFLQPCLKAGHECLVLMLEDGTGGYREGRIAEQKARGELRWSQLALPCVDFQNPEKLKAVVAGFKPNVVVSAGTLLAGAAACELAGDAPVWVDLFGDPLAEVQAKALAGEEAMTHDEHLLVWELMLKVLLRADAFSTVSRRQKDALLGQLLLMGMSDEDAGEGRTLFGLIHPIPCSMESFDAAQSLTLEERGNFLTSQGMPKTAKVVLCAGGFNVWLDVKTMARAVEIAMERCPGMWFVATGGGLPGYLAGVYREFQDLVEASPVKGRMRVMDWLPLAEAEKWARAADVGLMIDRDCAETRLGARNRLLSLAAARCPIVATRGTEVVEEMEAGDALAARGAGDVEGLARAIEALVIGKEEAAKMAARSLKFCDANYCFDVTARPFLEFVERAAVGAGREESLMKDDETVAQWVARYVDPATRRSEWEELAKFRSGKWNKLKGWVKSKVG
jgi:glycosyltransferase involved in cell wall biosynthesis